MGKITDALKKVADERVARVQKRPEIQYIIRKVDNTAIDQHIVSFHDPSSPIGEQYKILRTNILSLRQKCSYTSFAFTSALKGEGKTLTAVNTALAMACDVNNRSILLIDADMRKGSVARYLGINKKPGLSNILRGAADLEGAFVRLESIDNLTILPAGDVPKNPAELLSGTAMSRLIAGCVSKFDYVLIDTPPVMTLTDACIIGTLVDGVIVVIQAGATQQEVIRHMEMRLQQAHVRTVGYVLNNLEYHLPRYLYRYTQDYHYYSYYNKEEEKETGARV